MRKTTTTTLALLAACATSSLALGQTITVIYSDISGDPTSLVPAGAGVPAGTAFDAFDRPYRSPDGLRWIISASSDLATTEDELIIVGGGVVGATVVREGTAAGTPNAAELVGLIDRNLGITNTGEYSFATNTNGPTTSDEYVVLFNGVTWLAAAQEGAPVPGVAGEVFGATLNNGGLTNAGAFVAYRASGTVGGLPADQDDFLFIGPAMQAQSGVTIPGGAADAWQVFDTDDYYISADGLHSIVLGDLLGDTTKDDVAVVDGSVALQEGAVTGPFLSPIETILEVAMSSNGDWFSRGDNDDQQDWVYRNGTAVIASGDPIVLGTSEIFDDTVFSATFFWMGGNNVGDYVVGGTTNNADPEADAVLVLNGTTIIARQGDPVDLDANGVYDDNAFIDVFNNDDGFLTDAGILYFTANLYDAAQISLGQAYLRYDTAGLAPCLGDIEPVPADGVVDVQDLLALIAAWGACPVPCVNGCAGDLNGDCIVSTPDLLELIANWGPCP